MDRPACVDLHASLPHPSIREAVLHALHRFSPRVEVAADRFAFRLDAAGIAPLFASPTIWAEKLREALRRMGFKESAVAAGFSYFAVACTARCTRGVTIFETREAERAAVEKIPLPCLDLAPKTLHRLTRLDIRTLGDLIGLPEYGLLERFGPEVRTLHQNAARALWDPIEPTAVPSAPTATRILDTPETDRTRLTFLARRLLIRTLDEAQKAYRSAAAVTLTLHLDRAPRVRSELQPAEPTLDGVQLADLLRLRIEQLPLCTGVTEVTVALRTVPIPEKQMLLFQHKPRRDPEAANRALARLRAEFGVDAVVRAELKEGHLPEAGFAFVPIRTLQTGNAPETGEAKDTLHSNRPLIRRIYTRPIVLQTRPTVGPRGCHLLGMGEAPAVRMNGPFRLSGGWWNQEIRREYYYAETEPGRILWIFFDQQRRCWFLHGEVE